MEMVSFRLEVVTSSIQLAMVSGQVTTIYVYGYNQDQDQDHDHDHNRDHDHERDHDPDDDPDDDLIMCSTLCTTDHDDYHPTVIFRQFLGLSRSSPFHGLLFEFSQGLTSSHKRITNPQPIAGPDGRLGISDLFPFP